MGHVAQDVSRIAHNLVRALALDMADEADTTHGGDGARVGGIRLRLSEPPDRGLGKSYNRQPLTAG